jgi:hypothetical protein
MSFPVATSAQVLPRFGETTVLVNNGSAVVYVGVRRDTLPADGFPLQPLAQLTLQPGNVYFAQAATGVQALDMLPGGTGFAPSPSQVAAQIVASTLAAAIATAIAGSSLATDTGAASGAANYSNGSRLVESSDDTLMRAFLAGFSAGASVWLASNGGSYQAGQALIDVRGFHSFTLNAFCSMACQVDIYASDINGNVLGITTYELTPGVNQVVSDNLNSAYLSILLSNLSASSGNLQTTLHLSNRVMPGENLGVATSVALGGNFTGTDECLLSSTGTVAAGGNSANFIVPAVNGRYGITLGLGFAAQFKYSWGFGSGQIRQLVYPVGTNTYFELASTRRPLYCSLHSTDAASSTYGLVIVRAKD